ncbi:MAG: chitobiase/beta-hexosaminidase C-terminal domain-containing protein, partial [Paludibacter sp.]
TALQWMREACDANGMFLSLVMPNLTSDGVTEQKYGHMVRIDEDCAEGGWTRFSDNARGVKRSGWSQYANPFDGYVYWSKIAGRGKMILDGDFIRLNTYSNDEERKSVVSLHLIAGGPVSIADQYNSIGNSLWIYQNEELLALNKDGFVGVPLSNDPTNALSQVWKGQMANGDWIVGFFNRELTTQTRSISFLTNLGITGNVFVRDIWSHTDLGSVSNLTKSVVSHGCQIYRISTNVNKVISPVMSSKTGSYNGSCMLSLSTTTTGAAIYYTVDGTVPTSTSLLYSNPISIAATTTLKAIAIKSGMADSYVSKEIYTIIVPVPQTAMYVGGTFNTWNLANTPMSFVEKNSWTTSPVSITAGTHQMKFANTSNWSGIDWGNTSGLTGVASVTTGGSPNINFTVPVTTSYSITFDDASLAYSVINSFTSTSNAFSTENEVSVMNMENGLMVDINKNESAEIEIITINGQLLYKMNTSLKKNFIPIKSETFSRLLLVRVMTLSNTSTFKVML